MYIFHYPFGMINVTFRIIISLPMIETQSNRCYNKGPTAMRDDESTRKTTRSTVTVGTQCSKSELRMVLLARSSPAATGVLPVEKRLINSANRRPLPLIHCRSVRRGNTPRGVTAGTLATRPPEGLSVCRGSRRTSGGRERRVDTSLTQVSGARGKSKQVH